MFRKIFFLFLFILIFYSNIYAQRKVILLVINNISLQDISDVSLKCFDYLLKRGSVGLMNTRTKKSINSFSAYLTVGTGSRSYADEKGGECFNTEEFYENSQVKYVYFRRTGYLPPKNSIVNINISTLIKDNSFFDYEVKIGFLGKILRENNISTAVLGNADTNEEFHREIVNIAMDEKGVIDKGLISKEILVKDKFSPYGFRTNYNLLWEKFNEFYKNSDFIVIETGDTLRINEYSKFISEEVEERFRKSVLETIDKFISKLLNKLNEDNLLIIISPSPSNTRRERGDILTPLIFFSKNTKITSGFLTSSTTRQIGVVTNYDVLPTILDYFHIDIPTNLIGRVIKIVPTKDNVGEIISLNEKLILLESMRRVFLYFLVVFQIVILILSIIFIFLKVSSDFRITFLLILSSLPLSYLFLNIFPFKNLLESFLGLFLILIIITLVSKLIFKNRILSFVFICILTSLALIFDTLSGSNLMKFSPLGFSISTGARFYGIGNEYMGILIGATLLWTTLLIDYFHQNKTIKIISYTIFILVMFVLGSPKYGANFGGFITCFFSFFVVFLKLNKIKIDLKKFVFLCFLFFVTMSSIILIDLKNKGAESHLGRLIGQVQSSGYLVIFQTIFRKISMNLLLIRYTIWNKILLVCLGILLLLFYKPKKNFLDFFSKYPNLSIGLLGCLVGAVVGLIFNDSGIIVTSTLLIAITTVILYLIEL